MSELLKTVIGNGLPIAAGILGYFRPLDAAKLIGVVLIAGGTYGVLYSVSIGVTFGIPFADANNTLFAPALAGRNAAAGLATLIMSFLGKGPGRAEGYRKALGVLLACWMLAGFSDTAILLTTPGGENVAVHVRNIAVLMVVSFSLLR